jgi:hypothetical protein
MTNKAKLIFLIVFIVTSLLLQHSFSITEIQLKDVVRTTIGGLVAVFIISFVQNREKDKD